MNSAGIAELIARGTSRLGISAWLPLVLAVLAGLVALGSSLCGGDVGAQREAFRGAVGQRLVPQWTPDGNHLVFDRYQEYRSGAIYIVRSDGSRLRRISASSGDWENDYWPDVSPDGSRVVYTTSRHKTKGGRSYEIETSKLDGSDRRRLTDNPGHDAFPAWSPDGARIAFLYNRKGIVIMAADGADQRTVFDSLTFDPGTLAWDLIWDVEFDQDLNEYYRYIKTGHVWSPVAYSMYIKSGPVWSPDGEMLSFVGSVHVWVGPKNRSTSIGELNVLYTVGANGEGLTPLFVAGSMEDVIVPTLAWSPDGGELAFTYYDGAAEESDLHAIGRGGSGLRKLAEVGARGSLRNLSWSPNGDEILFVVNGAMYVAKADGSGYRRVAPGTYASWSPDGSRIAVRGGDPFLATMAPDGSDERLVVLRYTDGSLRAANPESKTCLLWFCW